MNSIFVVLMPWKQDGLTMKPLESFMTRPEAEDYIPDSLKEDWEIVEVRIPYNPNVGYLLKTAVEDGVRTDR